MPGSFPESHAAPLIAWIPFLPLIGFLANGLLGRWLHRSASALIACAAAGLSAVLALWATWDLLALKSFLELLGMGGAPQLPGEALYTWIPLGRFAVELKFRFDPLAALMASLVGFVGFFIHVYSVGYMAHDRSPARYFAYLNLFLFAMLTLVLADNLVLMFVGWEGVGLCSYLLIAFWYEDEEKARAGRKAFVVNRIGDFAFLLGILFLFAATGRLDFAGLEASPDALLREVPFLGGSFALVAGLLLFGGAIGKSAQFPLHVWLPDAMAGPTPVSALIHAATMVTAGVYMVVRLNFVYVLSPTAMLVVACLGAATAFFAGAIALAQNDIKKVLAYSTVSQLGFMFVAVGVGAFWVGIFHLLTHAFFKASLFLGAGSVIHALGGEQDIRRMGGLRRALPVTAWTFLAATAAIAGVPFFSGFFSKDEILAAALHTPNAIWSWVPVALYATGLVAALFTAFYMMRLYMRTFEGPSRAEEKVLAAARESPRLMTVPLVVLAAGAILSGYLGLGAVFTDTLFGGQGGREVVAAESTPDGGGYQIDYNLVRHWLAPNVGRSEAVVEGWRTAAAARAGRAAAAPRLAEEWLLVAAAVAVALLGLLGGFLWYRRGRVPPFKPPFHRVVLNKFYVDEIYQAIIVRPARVLADVCYVVIDEFVIDTLLVTGVAKAVEIAGRGLRLVQNGRAPFYAFLVAAGMGALLIWFLAAR